MYRIQFKPLNLLIDILSFGKADLFIFRDWMSTIKWNKNGKQRQIFKSIGKCFQILYLWYYLLSPQEAQKA